VSIIQQGDSTMRTTKSAKTKIILCVAITLGATSTALAASPHRNAFEQCVATHNYGSSDDDSLTGYDMAVGRCMELLNRRAAK
jgi:hypothetical protein